MLIYFEYKEKRRRADVILPKENENIIVHITDKDLTDIFPADLYFTIDAESKVVFEPEDVANENLLDLQRVLKRRLQEFVNKS